MSTNLNPFDSDEVDIDMAINSLFSGAAVLNSKRIDNEARQYVMQNASDIELCRDQLSRILDDVRGV